MGSTLKDWPDWWDWELEFTSHLEKRMKDRYLEVTFCKGKPLAAYLYLPRSVGAKSIRTEEVLPGLLVDFSATGEPIGLEIITPTSVTVSQINMVLTKLGRAAVTPEELGPLQAA